MVPMTRRTAASRALLAALIVIGCAGPEPSTSPDSSLAADLSPSTSPSVDLASPTPELTSTPPTVEPTIEPEPTPHSASGPRTELEINQNVVDRAGVPRSIRDNYWWTGSDVGLLGTTAQLGLPSNETVEDAGDGLVVSTRGRFDERATEIFVREFETGGVVGEVRTSLVVYSALVIGQQLFWAGMRPEKSGCGGWNVDGGVWVMRLDDDRGPVAIVEPGRVTDCGLGARGLAVSPSGQTLVSGLGNDHVIDVIDVSSASRTRRLQGAWPYAFTDDTFVQWDQPPTDGIAFGLGGMTAYDLESGAVRWQFPGDDWKKFGPGPFLARDSTFYIQYHWDASPTDLILARFDPLSGDRHVLLKQTDTREDEDLAMLAGHLSSDSDLVLSYTGGVALHGTSFSVLDIATGEVTWDSFTIDPPWLCSYGDCFRDG
jgi:hypothetical protein